MKKAFTILLILTIISSSCQDLSDTNTLISDKNTNTEIVKSSIYSKIGEKKENPLRIENIINAFNSLPTETKGALQEQDIIATHKYIAFTPSNEDELYALERINDNKILLFSYPLDYEVTDGIITPDSRFMTNGYSYRWAYIPIDYDLNDIKCPYVYYYDIFSPNEHILTKSGKVFPTELVNILEAKSYELCGYPLEPIINNTRASKVKPYGQIRFYDIDSQKFIGVDGLSIRTYRGTHSSYTHCDAEGNFTSNDSFRYAFNYEIHFSRTDFIIRKNSETNEIVIKYSGYKGPIYKDLDDAESTFYAVVSRAAIVYYYGNNCGLRRPPMKSDKTARLAIQANLSSHPNMYGSFSVNNRWILSDRPILNIYRDETTYRRRNIDIFATTIHELSHAAHWRNNQKIFQATDNAIIESFARGVQWIITSNAYEGYEVPFYYRQSYTGIVQDLIDGYKTRTSDRYATWVNNSLEVSDYSQKSYYDHVTGFTAQQIEETVRKSKTWNEWQFNLTTDYPNNANKTDISNAFTYWYSAN